MSSENKGSGLGVVGAFGLGAAVMYLLDPGRGARRRRAVRDKVVHALHKTEDAASTTGRDLRNRAWGLASEIRGRFEREAVDDDVLVARVRAELGRVVSHPSSIAVTAADGRVTLSGPVLASEAEALRSRIRGVRGVRDLADQLEVHERTDDVPGLQGGTVRRGGEFELSQENWSPAARLLVGAVGGALTLGGARRGDVLGAAIGLTGLALVSRSATNTDLRSLVGGGRGIEVQKAINIAAPIDDVFAFFTNYDNFPRFMSHVREVRDMGNGSSHWRVDGPAGVPVEWDAVLTALEPNDVLAWTSVPGSLVESAGMIRFAQNADGTTHVDLKMTYNPPAGAIGHAASKVLRVDPKKQLDDDLARAKTYLETGTPAHDAAQGVERGHA
ncbi:MAG: SRPBCC family protein [Gemmatimonadota bacterium]|nr:SRPBCC family protein [Gemmatimonadota bacterium]